MRHCTGKSHVSVSPRAEPRRDVETMPIHTNLPKQDQDAGGKVDAHYVGRFTHHGPEAVAHLAAQTGRHGNLTSLSQLNGIASVWSHPYLFCKALWEAHNTPSATRMALMARVARGEWRGLFATIALGNYYSLPLAFQDVTFNLPNPDGQAINNNKILIRLMARSWPEEVLGLPAAEGDEFARVSIEVVTLDGMTIGLGLPMPLFVPAREYDVPYMDCLPWTTRTLLPAMRGEEDKREVRTFIDPLKLDNIGPLEVLAITEFAEHVAKTLDEQREGTRLDRRPLGINDLGHCHVKSFLGDLQRRARELGVDPDLTHVPMEKLIVSPYFKQVPSPRNERYSALHPWSLKENDHAGVQPVGLYIDERLAENPYIPMREIATLTGGIEISRIRSIDQLFAGFPAELRKNTIPVLSDSDLLQPTLFRAMQGVHHPLHKELEAFLLPVKPLALLFVNPEELHRRLSIEEIGENTFRVRLNITLYYGNKSYPHVVERVYTGQNVVHLGTVTAASFWPAFRDPSWRENLFGTFEVKDPEFGYSAVIPSDEYENLAVALAKQGCTWERFDDHAWFQKTFPPDVDKVESTLEGATAPFQVSIWHRNRPIDAAVFRHRDGHCALVLGPFDAPNSKAAAAYTTCWIAVDIGTTNTNVSYEIVAMQGADNAPGYAELKNCCALPQEPIEGLDRGSVGGVGTDFLHTPMYVNFIPATNRRLPILTLLYSRTALALTQPSHKLLITHFIGYADNWIDFCAQSDIKIHGLTSYFRFKWDSPQGDDRQNIMRSFVSQLVTEIVAQLFKGSNVYPANIQWVFTFPSAFGDTEEANFRTVINEVLNRMPKELGPLDSEPVFLPESIAAYHYFQSHRTLGVGNLSLVMDIGGGTTDLALIGHDGGLLWHCSLKIGGRSVIIDSWKKKKHLIEDLMPDFLDLKGAQIESKIETILNLDDPFEKLKQAQDANHKNPLFHETGRRVEYMLYAILLYMSFVLQELKPVDVEQIGSGEDEESPLPRPSEILHLLLCGRGSRAIDNFLRPDDPELQVFNRFEAMTKTVWASLDITPDQWYCISEAVSQHPKQEVALGALDFVQFDRPEHGSQAPGLLPIGEFIPGRTPLDPMEDIMPDLRDQKLMDLKVLRALHEYLAAIDTERWGFLNNENWMTDVVDGAIHSFNRDKTKGEKAADLGDRNQPIFLHGVKCALNLWPDSPRDGPEAGR